MLSSIREGFNNEGKGYGGIIIAFFCYSSCGDETNCCTAESRIRFCFVETSSTSLRSHAEFQGNFNDGWIKVVLVRAYFDATPLLHPFAFTIYPPQEDGCTVGKQNHGSVNGIFQYTTLGRLTLFSIGQRVGPGRVRQLSTIHVDGWCISCCFVEWFTILGHFLAYSVVSV